MIKTGSRMLSLSAVAFGTACAELEPYTPKVTFQSLEVQDLDFERVDVDFVFGVENPNPIEISLSSFSYNLGLAEVHLLDGDDQDGMILEAVGTSELRLPVGLAWADAWNTVQATRGEDFVGFGLDGHFGFMTPIGEARVPYDEGGEFPAVRTPKFSFKNVRVTGFDGIYADVEVDLDVDNDHESTMYFEAFDYTLSMDNQAVATGIIADFGDAAGATTTSLTLPVSIDVWEAGTAVYNVLIGGGATDIGLDATMNVDTQVFGVLPLSIDETGNVTVETD